MKRNHADMQNWTGKKNWQGKSIWLSVLVIVLLLLSFSLSSAYSELYSDLLEDFLTKRDQDESESPLPELATVGGERSVFVKEYDKQETSGDTEESITERKNYRHRLNNPSKGKKTRHTDFERDADSLRSNVVPAQFKNQHILQVGSRGIESVQNPSIDHSFDTAQIYEWKSFDDRIVNDSPKEVGRLDLYDATSPFWERFYSGGSRSVYDSSAGVPSANSTQKKVISLKHAIVGTRYCETLDPLLGQAPYRWALAGGQIPPLLSFDPASGLLCGIPEKKGQYLFSCFVLDNTGKRHSVRYELTVIDKSKTADGGPLRILTQALKETVVGVQYFEQLIASGGEPPYSWSANTQSANLPSNISFNPILGVISGVAQKAGSYVLAVSLTDAKGTMTSGTFSLVVSAERLTITTHTLLPGEVGVDYSAVVTARGGNPPYVFSHISGAMPPGLSLDESSGSLSGIPSEQASTKLRIMVQDISGVTDSADLTLKVQGAELEIIDKELPITSVGKEYTHKLKARGGQPPYEWTMTSSTFTSGVNLSADGRLTGISEKSGSYPLSITVLDSNKKKVAVTLTLLVNNSDLKVLTDEVVVSDLCAPFVTELRAEGGASPWVWRMVRADLPFELNSNGRLQLSPESLLNSLGSFSRDSTSSVSQIEVSVSDGDSTLVSRVLPVRLLYKPPTFTPTDDLRCEVGVECSQQLTLSGGCSPFGFQATGLPQGLVLDKSGLLTGRPEDVGEYSFLVEVIDLLGFKTKGDAHLAILTPDLQILPAALPDISTGEDFDYEFSGAGGVKPYLWSFGLGNVPSGMEVVPSLGKLIGRPVKPGEYIFGVTLRDASGAKAEETFALKVISGPLKIDAASLGKHYAETGQAFQLPLVAHGGTPEYTWSVGQSSLPEGVVLLQGPQPMLTGNPLESGEYTISLTLADAALVTEDVEIELIVSDGDLEILAADPLDLAHIGSEYSVEFAVTGGVPGYTWSIVAGDLPEGLELNPVTGSIVGIPSYGAQSSTITIKVVDTQNDSAQIVRSLSVSQSDKPGIQNLQAGPSAQKVGLIWSNPAINGFASAIVIRSEQGFPTSLEDGLEVYRGRNDNFVDTGLVNGQSYYYSAFALYEVTAEGSTRPVLGDLYENSKAQAVPQTIGLSSTPDPFIDEVVSFRPLDRFHCFGCNLMPSIVLGRPQGGSDQEMGGTHVVSLGAKSNQDRGASAPYGGSITVSFADNICFDGPGIDFIVFENPWIIGNGPEVWIEPGVVEVSANGRDYVRFPFDFVPHYNAEGKLDLYNPQAYAKGFAGVSPVKTNGVKPDPTDPKQAGGDGFDLSDLPGKPFSWIKFVRITATGDGWLRDMNGDLVRQSNEAPTFSASGGPNSGFDLDAVVAVNY